MSQDELVAGNVSLRVNGVPLEFEMTVPGNPVKPQRVLPIFQKMANSMVEKGVEAIESQGQKISCKAHCGACCRQAVPISEVEVYAIAQLVEDMPEPRRTEVKDRFARAAGHFNSINWYERFLNQQEAAKGKDPDTAIREGLDVVMEYFHEGIPCPFLEDESCSIHQDRPVACREYLVTSPAEECANPRAGTVDGVDLMIKPSLALNMLGRTGNYSKFGIPILSRALELAELYPDSFEEKTGPEWMRDFFTTLSKNNMPKEDENASTRSADSVA